ncbi:MAG: nitroreductase [Alphaproteobacteria bacterium]|nr:nitroreductase [Alphaproteobacteria bacterium]
MAVLHELRDYLLTRRSVTLPFLGDPGPDGRQLADMLTMAVRVPDHGKLAPFRLITYAGPARARIGERLAALVLEREPDAGPERLDKERSQFLPAPLTVGVVSTAAPHPKIPEFEQLLAAGNVAFNLVHAANALGFGAHWVTRWFAYDAEAGAMLGLREGERFVGFVHIGTPTARLEERERPSLDEVVTTWQG